VISPDLWPDVAISQHQKYLCTFHIAPYVCDTAGRVRVSVVRTCCRALADVDKDGRVDCREFSIAMYLIKRCLHGHELPSSLPSSLQVDPVAVQTGSLLCDWTTSSMFGMPVSAVRPLPAPHGYCLSVFLSMLTCHR